MFSSSKFHKFSVTHLMIAGFIALAFLVVVNAPAHAQGTDPCIDPATGAYICTDTPPPPPPPPPSKPKATSTSKPRPTRTQTPTPTYTETPTSTVTDTATAPATAIDTSTATTAPTGIPTKGLPTPTEIKKGGGLTQGLGMQSSNMPALLKGGSGILIIGVLLAGGFGIWRFFGKRGKSGGGSNVEVNPGPSQSPTDQFMKEVFTPNGSSDAGRESPSKQYIKFESQGGSDAGRESPSKQYLKYDSQGSPDAGRESPSNQYIKFESQGGSDAGRESPSNQYGKTEKPPSPNKPGV